MQAQKYSEVEFTVSGHVGVVTLNRPERLNAWTSQMGAEVHQIMHGAADDEQVRVIVLTGAGRGFCAGVDISRPTNAFKGDQPRTFRDTPDAIELRAFQRKNTYFPTIPKPIIAAINGPCAGIGLSMALFCDMRFASESSVFTTAFARRGLIAEHGMSWTLPRLVGHSAATDLILSARKIAAAEALKLGMVDRVYNPDELMSATLEYAKEMSEFCSPRSLAVMKKQLWLSQTQSFTESMDLADHEMDLSLKSEDHKEGVRHFLEKRPPSFTGR